MADSREFEVADALAAYMVAQTGHSVSVVAINVLDPADGGRADEFTIVVVETPEEPQTRGNAWKRQLTFELQVVGQASQASTTDVRRLSLIAEQLRDAAKSFNDSGTVRLVGVTELNGHYDRDALHTFGVFDQRVQLAYLEIT